MRNLFGQRFATAVPITVAEKTQDERSKYRAKPNEVRSIAIGYLCIARAARDLKVCLLA